jgi:hypothetical protein
MRALAVTLLLAACDGPAVGAVRASIVAGVPDHEHGSVVAMVNVTDGGLCTATLVAPRVALLAKHCVQPPGAAGPVAPHELVLISGETVFARRAIRGVVRVSTTDGAWDLTPEGGTTGAILGVDVAVVTIDAPFDGLSPVAIRDDRIGPLIGMDVTAVGYGSTPEGGNAERRRTTARIRFVTGNVIVTTAAICVGDSGGPMIDPDGRVAAVASLGPATCGDGPGAFNALDVDLRALIDGAIAAAATEDALVDAGPPPDAGPRSPGVGRGGGCGARF